MMHFSLIFIALLLPLYSFASQISYPLPKETISAEKYLQANPQDGEFYGTPEVDFPFHPIFSGRPYDTCVTQPGLGILPTFLLRIPKGRVFGKQGVVITKDHQVIRELANSWSKPPEKHGIFRLPFLPDAEYIDQSVASITTLSAECYYHWMIDVLPKLAVLEKNGIKPDYYYLDYQGLPFQKESLEILGIDLKNVLIASDNTHFQCQNLIAPSLVGNPACAPKWACTYFKERFVKEVPLHPTQRIYISRKKATARRIINEEALIAFLDKYQFQTVYLEDLSLLKQAELFADAEVIVGIHGSGLANMIFCNSNNHIVELIPPQYINPCFYGLAHNLGVPHHPILGAKDSRCYGQDFLMDSRALEELDQLLMGIFNQAS